MRRQHSSWVPDARTIRAFRRTIGDFYRTHGRAMPWRETADPYCIIVSEIMLQQTQVERVRDKYLAFMKAFPDFRTLAATPLQEVLSLWQGLGYNRRAIALKHIAETVVESYDGKAPASVERLRMLPGIGHATASSIAAFAFNMPTVFIETNIRRVFLHRFFEDREGVHDDELLPIIAATLDRKNPRRWYYALMDYGADLKRRVPNPNRKSRHYARQSRFEGSTRQKRGQVLKFILAHTNATPGTIAKALNLPGQETMQILHQLLAEGFLIKSGRYFGVV